MDEAAFLSLISGERRGPGAAALRGALSLASAGFRLGAAARGAAYAAGLLATHRPPLPVISVGNLTAGGTGKTPLVILLARELVARGERVAVLARGYGAARDGELNDEMRLIGEACPEALLLPGRDRVARAREAARAGATVALLDDGFQHRRLGRAVDLVLLDATRPWGPAGGRLLPRGLLREPASALRRADAVVLTRAEQAPPEALVRLEVEVRRAGFQGPVLHLLLLPGSLRPLDRPGEAAPPDRLEGARVLAACGIGNPDAFAGTLRALGARVVGLQPFADHHAYTAEDVAGLEARARALDAERVVVTGKDAVKLRPLIRGPRPVPWDVVGLAARLDPSGAAARIVGQALGRRAAGPSGPREGTTP